LLPGGGGAAEARDERDTDAGARVQAAAQREKGKKEGGKRLPERE